MRKLKLKNNNLPKGWRKVKLGEIIKINPPVCLIKSRNYPFVEMADVNPGYKYVKASQFRKYKGGGVKFERGDILFARITPSLEHGKIAQVRDVEKGFGSTEFFVLRAREHLIDKEFLFYLVKTYNVRKKAEKSMFGVSGRQRVERAAFENIEVTIPQDINEQKRIAEILSAFDEKIELNNKINQILEEMAQAIFKEWFVDFRFSGSFKIRFLDRELGDIPAGWEIATLSELLYFEKGSTTDELFEENIPGSFEYLTNESFSKNKRRYTFDESLPHVEEGDVLMIMDGEAGRIIRARPGVLGSTVARVIPKRNSWNNLFLYFWLKSIEPILLRNSMGTSVQHVDKNFLKTYQFVIPPDDYVKKFQNIVNPIMEKVILLRKENQELSALRDLLLPKLMSGEVKV